MVNLTMLQDFLSAPLALGQSWSLAYELQPIPAYDGVNFNTPRVELPTRCSGTLPILQQYSDTESQKLMLFRVPMP